MKTVNLQWGRDAGGTSLSIVVGSNKSLFSVKEALVGKLPLLPLAIAAHQPVEKVAAVYKELLRTGLAIGGKAHGPNAMERLIMHLGDRATGPVNIRMTTADRAVDAMLGLPWELLLHDNEPDQLRETLARISLARSLGATSDLAPRDIDGQFRVLLVQGADDGAGLGFEAERTGLANSWRALGRLLGSQIAEPQVRPARLDCLVDYLVEQRPHLLWFSGHGRGSPGGFELLFDRAGGGEWRSVSELSVAIREARDRTRVVPFIAAFWACEGARANGVAARPIMDASSDAFPFLVRTILDTGVEAVVGVQTQVYDSTARLMGESFFRALAEGQGPAAALATARSDLHCNPSRLAPGSASEWTSPVLWINGADMPEIHWLRPVALNEAVVLQRLGRETLLAFEGGRDILAAPVVDEAPWRGRAPLWLVCPELHQAAPKLRFLQHLHLLLTIEGSTVLLVQFDSINDSALLDAVARAFREVKRRLYPQPSGPGINVLTSLFQAFNHEKRRRDAWLWLIEQPNITVAIIAEGGIPGDDKDLVAAQSGKAQVIVIANKPPGDGAGGAIGAGTWQVDDLKAEKTSTPGDEATSALLVALAVLNRPLAADSIGQFARDFGLDGIGTTMGDYLIPFGHRYVVRAALAERLRAGLSDDQSRAAHRACLNFLERGRHLFDAASPTQLAWRVHHALGAGEIDTALSIADKTIEKLSRLGDYAQIIALYRTLGKNRTALPAWTKAQVAFAQIQMGQAQRGYDLIRQIPLDSLNRPGLLLNVRVIEAEALRTLRERSQHEKAIEVLEHALAHQPSGAADADAYHWSVVAQHDLARNLLYFRGEAVKARDMFELTIERCESHPDLAYTKAAAYRNLADMYGRYGYGEVAGDLDRAESYLLIATDLARNEPGARPLLAELLYFLAKIKYARQQKGEAGNHLREAIEVARERGAARVLALALNKRLWWQAGPLAGLEAIQLLTEGDWQRLDTQLDLISDDPWIARALVTARVRAARCLHLHGDPKGAAAMLEKARSRLEEDTVFLGAGDFVHRWQPVFAGLALLGAEAPAAAAGLVHDEVIWNELKELGKRIMGSEPTLSDPRTIWEGVN